MLMDSNFTSDEIKNESDEFKAVCLRNGGYKRHLTEGKTYLIKMQPSILEGSPLCSFDSDMGGGKRCSAHLVRFKKLEGNATIE